MWPSVSPADQVGPYTIQHPKGSLKTSESRVAGQQKHLAIPALQKDKKTHFKGTKRDPVVVSLELGHA